MLFSINRRLFFIIVQVASFLMLFSINPRLFFIIIQVASFLILFSINPCLFFIIIEIDAFSIIMHFIIMFDLYIGTVKLDCVLPICVQSSEYQHYRGSCCCRLLSRFPSQPVQYHPAAGRLQGGKKVSFFLNIKSMMHILLNLKVDFSSAGRCTIIWHGTQCAITWHACPRVFVMLARSFARHLWGQTVLRRFGARVSLTHTMYSDLQSVPCSSGRISTVNPSLW